MKRLFSWIIAIATVATMSGCSSNLSPATEFSSTQAPTPDITQLEPTTAALSNSIYPKQAVDGEGRVCAKYSYDFSNKTLTINGSGVSSDGFGLLPLLALNKINNPLLLTSCADPSFQDSTIAFSYSKPIIFATSELILTNTINKVIIDDSGEFYSNHEEYDFHVDNHQLKVCNSEINETYIYSDGSTSDNDSSYTYQYTYNQNGELISYDETTIEYNPDGTISAVIRPYIELDNPPIYNRFSFYYSDNRIDHAILNSDYIDFLFSYSYNEQGNLSRFGDDRDGFFTLFSYNNNGYLETISVMNTYDNQTDDLIHFDY